MTRLLSTFVEVLAQLSPFLLIGFAAAGLLHAFVPGHWLARAVGGSGLGPVLRGALIGVPLPLCSCGVIPVAVELRKRGAGRGATASFLVATPETGVDSVAASMAVLHPVMVVFRPIAAFLTAVATGIAVERFSREPAAVGEAATCCHGEAGEEIDAKPKGLVGGMRYAFVDLFGEVGTYLVPAILITAALTVLLEPAALAGYVPQPWLQMLLLLLLGIPVYVCAAAATPVAAGLIVAGFSPGAALVFLLAGPATNLVTISAAARTLGKAGAAIYLGTVATASLVCGAVLDLLFENLAIPTADAASLAHEHIGWVQWTSGGVIGLLIVWHVIRKIRSRDK